MDVKVVSKVGQAFSRSLGSLSLADGSMLLRMRRASFALFALVGAVGLGLLVFIAQLGWPGVVSGPLPGPPTRAGTVDTAVALAESPATAAGAIGPAAVEDGRPARDSSQRESGGTNNSGGQGSSQLGRAKKLAAAPGAQPGQGSNQPAAQPPASTPAPAPTTPTTSAPSTVVVESPPQSSSADQAKKASSNPRTTETAVTKAVSDSAGSTGSNAKSQGQKSATDRGTSSGSSKASEAASAKAKRDESAAKAKAPPVAAAPAPSAPPAQSPAAAKEAADAAR